MVAKTTILKKIKDIEEQYDIKVVFAVESGSRVWNFASKDSDYDIRCVHVSKGHRYLGIDNPPEQIDSLNEIKDVDICSWDIKKFMKLLYYSNPTVSEWLSSNIIYKNSEYRKQLQELFQKKFCKDALLSHYISMAKQNYFKYIKDKDLCSLKKYCYVLRAIACYEYIIKENNVPPIMWTDVKDYLPNTLKEFFIEVVELKKKGENAKDKLNVEVNNLIEEYLDKKFDDKKNNFDLKEINAITKNIIVLQGT